MRDQRFSEGVHYRIEIPSVEGPRVFAAVLEEAERRSVPVRRISQGSGVMMLTDGEIREMVRLGADAGVEISLFLGPRGAWDAGGQSLATAAAGGVARGLAGIEDSVSEVLRGVALGIRSFLVADLGVLARLGTMRGAGELPDSLVLKTSVLLPCANLATARVLEELGATTINVATDLSPEALGELRAACAAPLDVYVEVPDDQGGFVRFYEVPEMIRRAAPMYVKLGVRNAPNIYPSGVHLEDVAVKLGRERVRRAELVLRLLAERAPELVEGRGRHTGRPRHTRAVRERLEAICTAALATSSTRSRCSSVREDPGRTVVTDPHERSVPRERDRRAVACRHAPERRGVAASKVGPACVKPRRLADREVIEHSIRAVEHGEPTPVQVDVARCRLAAA